jgi:hypothetical protein
MRHPVPSQPAGHASDRAPADHAALIEGIRRAPRHAAGTGELDRPHQRGSLTDAEYATERAKLLGTG